MRIVSVAITGVKFKVFILRINPVVNGIVLQESLEVFQRAAGVILGGIAREEGHGWLDSSLVHSAARGNGRTFAILQKSKK